MNFQRYDDDSPADVKSAKVSQLRSVRSVYVSQLMEAKQGLHLVTQNTPNGQKVQIFLEELADAYGTEWTTTLMLVQHFFEVCWQNVDTKAVIVQQHLNERAKKGLVSAPQSKW